MRACGTELRRSLVCSIRGSTMSSAYFSSPMHFALASTLMRGFPMTFNRRLPPLFPAIQRLLGGLRLLTADTRGRQFHRFEYFDIARAAADVPGQGLLDFIARGPGTVFEQSFRSEENSRRAISTLSSAEFGKRLLQWMKFGSRHSLYRRDFMPLHRDSQSKTRKYGTAIDEHSTASAFAQFTSMLRAGQSEVFTQDLEKRLVRGERHL